MTKLLFSVSGVIDVDPSVLGIAMANMVAGGIEENAEMGLGMQMDPEGSLTLMLKAGTLGLFQERLSAYELGGITVSASPLLGQSTN